MAFSFVVLIKFLFLYSAIFTYCFISWFSHSSLSLIFIVEYYASQYDMVNYDLVPYDKVQFNTRQCVQKNILISFVATCNSSLPIFLYSILFIYRRYVFSYFILQHSHHMFPSFHFISLIYVVVSIKITLRLFSFFLSGLVSECVTAAKKEVHSFLWNRNWKLNSFI